MAINKSLNVNLQITLLKEDAEKLASILKELSASLGFEITKSQAITYLIRNYKTPKKAENSPKATPTPKKTETTANAPIINDYQRRILELKNKLGKSYKELAEMLNIPFSNLKKYGIGKYTPKGINAEILNDAFKKYGIE